jgi:hypothetical protein
MFLIEISHMFALSMPELKFNLRISLPADCARFEKNAVSDKIHCPFLSEATVTILPAS